MAARAEAIELERVVARAVPPVAVLGAVGACFLAAHGDLGRPANILALLLALGLASLAYRHPEPAACTALALVVFAPTYWAQPLPVLPLAGTAAAITGIIVLPGALSAARVNLTVLDGFVAMFFLVSIASIVANVDGKQASIADFLARVVIPYVVFRILAARDGMPRRLAMTMVAIAVPLSILGLREAAGHGNPFFTLLHPGFEAAQWAHEQARFGQVRAEASFGHAIAFSLFLAIVLMLVLGLSWRATGGGRIALLAVSVLLVAALLATVSRGGLLALIVAVVVWALTLRSGRQGLLVVAAIVALGLVLTPAGTKLARLQHSITDTSEAGSSVEFRLEIAELVTQPKTFSILGEKAPPGLGVVAGAKELLGLRTIDSQYALVYVTDGALGLAVFVLVGLGCFGVALRRRVDPLERAWVAATAGTAVALGTVALFTQMLTLFWIAVAVTSAIASRARA